MAAVSQEQESASGAKNAVPFPPKKEHKSVFSRMAATLRRVPKKPDLISIPLVKSKAVVALESLEKKGAPIDDRQLVMKNALTEVLKSSNLPQRKKIKDAIIKHLHKEKRSAAEVVAGSGEAGSAETAARAGLQSYVRTVPTQHVASQLPEPEELFNEMLRAESTFEHLRGVSGFTYAIGTLLSLSMYRTDSENTGINKANASLDLSPLYGCTPSETKQIRVGDGRGQLHPDAFYEDRLVNLPPSVSVILILFNRNHNFIAQRLLLINESGLWKEPAANQEFPNQSGQDEEIFQMARSINCAHFKNIVAEDFLKGLVGFPSTIKNISLDFTAGDSTNLGRGNVSTVESSLLYSFPSLMAPEDARQAEDLLVDEFSSTLEEITPDQYLEFVQGVEVDTNRTRRDCAGLRRGRDGRFNDDDLAAILQSAIESPAGATRARGMPSHLRFTQIATIRQARDWKVCTLNEYRRDLGLKPYKTFKDWNPTPEVIEVASRLYKGIDELELYPGLQAEETVPGEGFSLGYTMTYGLLVDMAATIRNDPRFTTDYTAAKLSKWGLKECKIDEGGAHGLLPKLLQRNLPRNFPYNNAYGVFPLTTPSKAKQLLEDDERANDYDFGKPVQPEIKSLVTREGIRYAFNHPDVFASPYGKDLEVLTKGYGYFLGFDHEKLHDQDQLMTLYALMPDRGALARYATFYRKTAKALVALKADTLEREGARSIDIVRDVINATCTRWVCETLFDHPLPNEKEVQETFEELAALYTFVFRNLDTEQGLEGRAAALKASEKLCSAIDQKLPTFKVSKNRYQTWKQSIIDDVLSMVTSGSSIALELTTGQRLTQTVGHTFLDRLVKINKSFGINHLVQDVPHLQQLSERAGSEDGLERSRLIANVLGLAVVAAVNYAQACSQAVDFYLDDKRGTERKEIIELCKPANSSTRTNELLMGYIREAQRLGQPLGLYRVCTQDTIVTQGSGHPDIHCKAGERIYADFSRAHLNSVDFPHPEMVDPHRKTPSIQGLGLHKCPGIPFVEAVRVSLTFNLVETLMKTCQTMPEIFRVVFSLDGIESDPNGFGRLKRFDPHPRPIETDPKLFVDANGIASYVPKSLKIRFKVPKGETKAGPPPPLGKKKWKLSYGKSERYQRYRLYADVVLKSIAIFCVIWSFYWLVAKLWRAKPQRTRVESNPVVHAQTVECREPMEVFHPYNITSLVLDDAGNPQPLVYTLNSAKAHRLAIIDIDGRDVRMSVTVDGVVRGLTRDLILDKNVTCGLEDLNSCLTQGFSAGLVVIPSGEHTVMVKWVGKEIDANTGLPDWGDTTSRRIVWQREYCA